MIGIGLIRAAAALAAVGAFLFAAARSPAAEAAVSWVALDAAAQRYRVETRAIPEAVLRQAAAEAWTGAQWQQVFSVRVASAAGEDPAALPPMLGAYRAEGAVVRFEPQFSLTPGATYRATVTGGPFADFQVPARAPTAPTRVSQVFPSADVLPENLLKFYIHFSAPMNAGGIYRHIHLLGEDGREVEGPFLELGEELWDASMMRVTILLEPGRIKRGLQELADSGAPLTAGKRHTLVVDAAWADANGQPLKEGFRKNFRVGPADRVSPDAGKWKIAPPAVGTRAPLTVTFDGSMDHALALRLLRVVDPSGADVRGTATLGEREERWSFVPDVPWRAGAHRLVTDAILEDIAGNNLGKLFDVDVFENVQRTVSSEKVSVPFVVR